MKVLWAPWRLSYVENPDKRRGCIFCDKPSLEGSAERREALVLYSNEHSSVLINKFPYTNGNLMVAAGGVRHLPVKPGKPQSETLLGRAKRVLAV